MLTNTPIIEDISLLAVSLLPRFIVCKEESLAATPHFSSTATIRVAWWEVWKLPYTNSSRQMFIKCILAMLFILLFVMNSTSYSIAGHKGLKDASTETYTIPPCVVSIDSPSPLPFFLKVLPIPTAAIL